MQLTETQAQIRNTARRFAEREISPHAADWDRAAETPRVLYRKMADAGLIGITVAPEHGGSGADFLPYVLAIEEIASADGGISNMMAATNSPVAVAIEENGTDRQKRDYLSRLTGGDWLGCIHLTEPHTGSDAAAIRTRAERDGDHFVLNGEKAFITGGATAELAMILAVTNPDAGKRGITTFITPTDNPGYQVIRKEAKLGHRTNDTCQVRFENMRIPATDVLGEPGAGLRIALSKLSEGRIAVAAQAVGGARAALKAARTYAHSREAFGKPIVEHQAIGFKLAEMATQMEASMAKLFASEIAERVASDAIQVHGGAGFLNDYPVEKIYRDVRVYQIYEGTSEVQKIVISRFLDNLDL